MDGYQLFLVLLAAYIAVLVAIGWYCGKNQRSVTDFWLAGRKIGPVATGLSAAASWLTAGGLLAVIGFYMLSGMGSIWGFVAPNILALLIIAAFVKKIKNLPSITQPELLEQRYSSAIRAPVALIITIVMILFAVADIKGFAFLLQVFYGLSPVYAAVIVGIAVSLYVTLGGLSAVVWTDAVQFVFLAGFALAMAAVTSGAAASVSAMGSQTPFVDLLASVPDGWWNPFSIGIPMVLIFSLAIIPGWISEQDPWQRVWAAKDERSAKVGLILGSFLITVVFSACAAIAIGLNILHPEIAKMGFPAGMALAEPALLNFIMESHFSQFALALCAIGLAAAAMSCADTFAASGASCISRDLYQRYLKPDATMKEMLRVNRISVLIIVLAATLASFMINSIIDAIHIATFIASASYFFPLMGGLYWKRATTQGALAGLGVGAVVQITLVLIDVTKTPAMAPPFLESLHPLLMGHGVILGMALSATAFFGVSLATPAPMRVKLAPFFKDEADLLPRWSAKIPQVAAANSLDVLKIIGEKASGKRTQLYLNLKASGALNWNQTVEKLKAAYPAWVTPSGMDAVYRLTHSDMLSCVAITRGGDADEIWFEAKPLEEFVTRQKNEFFKAYTEVFDTLQQSGIRLAIAVETRKNAAGR